MTPKNARHLSKTDQHFTPRWVYRSARLVMGDIDLDPASNAEANRFIEAKHYFDVTRDGLRQDWFGRVFLNPPGGKTEGRSNQKTWWFKLAAEHYAGTVEQAIFVCFSVELFQTSQNNAPNGLALPLDFPMLIPSRRIKYLSKPGGKVGYNPPHASAVIYLPPRTPDRAVYERRFWGAFHEYGKILNCRAPLDTIPETAA